MLQLEAAVQRKDGDVWNCLHYSWMLQFRGRMVMSGIVYITAGCYSSGEGWLCLKLCTLQLEAAVQRE